jgi:O-antigen/teichoic acid export membrane protein
MLFASLVGTLGVAVTIRIWMPRYLGPDAFGRLAFAEDFATAAMFLTNLGVETYIRREVARRPAHASEFFGGLVVVRLLGSVLVAIAMAALLTAMKKPHSDWGLVYIFGMGQVAFVLNSSLNSLLQAVGKVRETAIYNVVSKVMWGAGIYAGLRLGMGVIAVPVSFFATEALKVPVFLWACRENLGLRLRFDLGPMKGVLVFSFPFFLNQLGHELYGRLGVTTMSSMASHAEVGWFGAANQVKTLVQLALPIITAVLLPMSSRLATDAAVLNEVMRSTVRLALVLTAPLAVVLALDAEWIVRTLFSSEFMPATGSLRVLAVLIPLSCYAVLSAMHLMQLDRIWGMTFISLGGLAAAALLNPIFIGYGVSHYGRGGAGMGAAAAAVVTEFAVDALMFVSLGRAGGDRRLAVLALKLTIVFAAMIGLHVLLAPHGFRGVLLDGASWLVLGTLAGAIPARELAGRVRAALKRGRPVAD